MSQPIDPALAAEAARHGAAQLHEYTGYVAAVDIMHGNALAYRAGDPVPRTNAEAHGYLDAGLVKPVERKADTDAEPAQGGGREQAEGGEG